jgi:hypothetical protein
MVGAFFLRHNVGWSAWQPGGDADCMLRLLARKALGEERYRRLKLYQLQGRAHPRIAMALARAAATSSLRNIDPANPSTWEFSGFSQNGEDGIIDYLCSRLLRPNRYFVEVGASNGLENNTTWLAFAKRYAGLMIDGDSAKIDECRKILTKLNYAVEFASMMVSPDRADVFERLVLLKQPDVFSLDIDSVDYYVAEAFVARVFRPKIVVVEYNSTFGPERAVTIPYQFPFNRHRAHPSGNYYGVSVMGLRHLLEGRGYRFITVDQNGVNAFFVDPREFDTDFLSSIQGSEFRENTIQRRESRTDWRGQLAHIATLPLVEIPREA